MTPRQMRWEHKKHLKREHRKHLIQIKYKTPKTYDDVKNMTEEQYEELATRMQKQ